MKQLYKNSFIQVMTIEELKNFNYDNFEIRQIEQIGENFYAVEILGIAQYKDILHY